LSGVKPRASCLPASLLILFTACGGGGGGGTGPTPARIQVGGQYSTAVTLTEDTCGGTTVMPLPTSVAHNPGDTRFTLTHGGTTYNGTLSADGSFRTETATVNDGAGATHTLGIEGRFSAQGFDANVSASVRRTTAPTSCRYAVHWVGTKQGAPNVIP
jgi:hypothetical protein